MSHVPPAIHSLQTPSDSSKTGSGSLPLPGRASRGRINAFVSLLACLFSLLATACTQAQTDTQANHNRYNVLFIAVDDLRPELGCFGVDYVKTPNIDRLASTGIVFKQHFVSVPTCGASRYALLTCRDPSNSGGNDNGAMFGGRSALKQEQLPGAQTLPELFRRSGYHTTLIGKISHTPDGKVYNYNGTGDGRPEMPGAWDDFATPYGPWQRGWGAFFAYADGKHREDGGGHRDLLQFVVDKDTDLPDGLMAQTAIEKLKALKQGGKPFFMGLGFFKPHLPFVAPRQDWDAVAKWDVPTPVFREGMDSDFTSNSGEFYGYHTTWQKTRPLALDSTMQAKRGYLACMRYTDRQVGKVLDALDELGLADNTIVVLWGDHGWFLGEGAMWGKHSALEFGVHSPLIIRAPGTAKPGRATDAIASTLDIYPTLIDLCKPTFTKTEHQLDGVSLKPILTGEREAVRGQAWSWWRGAFSSRSLTHRFIAKPNKDGTFSDIELYDLRNPDGPWVNVADQQPEVVKYFTRKPKD